MKVILKTAFLIILALVIWLTGCGKQSIPTPAPINSDASSPIGDWMQFIPVEAMPKKLTFSQGGSAISDNSAGKWRLEKEKLLIRVGGQESAYDYTVTGYMLTLVDNRTDTSSFYINPAVFSQRSDDNAKFAGQWAFYSSYTKLLFDGKDKLDMMSYDATNGKSVITMKYTARDGILQDIDAAGNVTYNLYTISGDEYQLAETVDYDKDEKQWSSYSKMTAESGLDTRWKRVINLTAADAVSLPEVLELKPDGIANITQTGGSPVIANWEYYADGFIILQISDYDMQYAYSTANGISLFLSSADDSQSWYVNDSFPAALKPPADITGKWKSADAAVEFQIDSLGNLKITQAGKTINATATAAGGILVLRQGGNTYYMAYIHDGDTLLLNYTGIPFLSSDNLPLGLAKVGP